MVMPTETESHSLVIFLRHGLKAQGGVLSPEGKAQAKDAGRNELVGVVESLPDNAVMALIGVSRQARTQETMAGITQGLQEANPAGVHVLNLSAVQEKWLQAKTDFHETRALLVDEIRRFPNQKIVIELPLKVLEIGMERLLSVDPEISPYAEYNNRFRDDQVIDWLEEYVHRGSSFGGPSADAVANTLFRGFDRLLSFIQHHLPDDQRQRFLAVGIVGHSWAADAALAKALNGGEFDETAITKLGGQMIKETEMALFGLGSREVTTRYRGQTAVAPIFWRDR
jgi:hypothetical protein